MWGETPDGQTRLEAPQLCAMRNRRTFGYVVDILEGGFDNTDTPSNFTAVARLLFTSADGSPGCAWARVQALSSNFATISGEAIIDGEVADGILVETYGAHLTATFGSLRKSSLFGRRQNGAGPPRAAEGLDLDPWSRPPLPELGGSWFDSEKELLRITGVPVLPPPVVVYQ